MKRGESFRFDEYLYGRQKQCAETLKTINAMSFDDPKRTELLRGLFGSFGDGNVVKDGLRCNFGFNISIGNDCYINYGVTILDSFEVVIGNNVFIAPNVVISPVTHPIEAARRRDLMGGRITVCDDVWIGAGAVILPNVTIGKGAVIGAGAVVNKNVEPNTVVGGVPAKFIKNIVQ